VIVASGLSPSTYLLAKSGLSDGLSVVPGLAAPKSPLQVVITEIFISAG